MKSFLIISIIVLPYLVQAQNQDFLIWVGANVSKTYKKKFTVIGEAQGRFNQNATNMYRYLLQGRFQYQPKKYYKIGVNYRFSDWNFTNTHRIDLDNYLRYKVEKEHFDVRLRLQRKFGFQTTIEDRVRVRFRYQHKFDKRFTLYGKAEYFYSKRFNLSTFDMQRYTVGAKFRVALKHFFDVFYRYEFEQNVERPRTRFVAGVIYNLKL